MSHDSVPTPTADPTVPTANPFTIAGRVDGWEPRRRQLTIGDRHLWVAATMSVVGLAVGALIVANGHEEGPSRRWIVTQFTLG
jgi:hypothetical protein